MAIAIIPTTFRSGRVLRGPVPSDFEAFYRNCLRFQTGARMRTRDVADRYHAWAAENAGSSLNMRELRRIMDHIGHRHLKSNGMFYADVRLAREYPRLVDNFPVKPLKPEQAPDIAQRLDAIMDELRRLRTQMAV